MSKVTASAPGKLFLFGEHAVVYNRPVLVTAIDLRTFVSIEHLPDKKIILRPSTTQHNFSLSPEEILSDISEYPSSISFLLEAIKHIYRTHNLSAGIDVSTSGPVTSYGLGSSSSVTVATIKALDELFDLNMDRDAIFNHAYQVVKNVQGIGSGADIASAIYGGTIWFAKGGQDILPIYLQELPIIIGFSNTEASTVEQVKKVAQLRKHHSKLFESIFDLIENITIEARTALEIHDWRFIGELMNIHQGALSALNVSTLPLSKLIHASLESGAWGAKLSGAGGGDCMFTIAEPRLHDKIKSAIENHGGKIVNLSAHAEGVKIEPFKKSYSPLKKKELVVKVLKLLKVNFDTSLQIEELTDKISPPFEFVASNTEKDVNNLVSQIRTSINQDHPTNTIEKLIENLKAELAYLAMD